MAGIVASSLVVLMAVGIPAEGGPIDAAIKACEPELTRYCSQVTPGEGRLLACFYAHGDKISGSCEFALYTAAGELEQFVNAISLLAEECHRDLQNHCGEVESGDGRVASCLLEHRDEVSERCKRAMDVTGLEADG